MLVLKSFLQLSPTVPRLLKVLILMLELTLADLKAQQRLQHYRSQCIQYWVSGRQLNAEDIPENCVWYCYAQPLEDPNYSRLSAIIRQSVRLLSEAEDLLRLAVVVHSLRTEPWDDVAEQLNDCDIFRSRDSTRISGSRFF